MKKHKGIILDRDYSNELIRIAYRDNYIDFNNNTKSENDLIKSFLNKNRNNNLQYKALELVLLNDEIYLNDPFELATFDKLKKEGLIKEYRYLDNSKKVTNDEIKLSEEIKPLLKPFLVQYFSKRKPYLDEIEGLAEKFVDGLYDFMTLWRAGLHKDAVEYTDLPLKNILGITGDPVEHIKNLSSDLEEGNMHGFNVDMLDIDFEISSIIQLMDMSKELNSSFVSNRIRDVKENIDADIMNEAYRICLIEMKDVIKYTPRVESIEDVLRLKEKKEIHRFREVLNEWATLLSNGDLDHIDKIKKDIIKANKEITNLEKWKKVDKWLYYASIPSMIHPIPSSIVTIGSASLRCYMERKENKYGWVGIGR
ncbi:Uncharacterised protein [[Clostridium] sordellii]|uniref:hypothetical protein n=1 Tax=Paraclostridium sordellii TaxID=1505 RepID=UPI0005E136C5|nr:hypothetical protein [Paeniclostridium sordellii]MBX9180203.1 hypothetical protein [Paeniclostridium sordellii]CEO10610.1 Uncharacterised protein [[Clostridium] sordellii] [Paeniclostridium sordellii]